MNSDEGKTPVHNDIYRKRTQKRRITRRVLNTLLVTLFILTPVTWYIFGAKSDEIADHMLGANVNYADSVGVWGDSFGAFNSLVSGLAFSALVLTLAFQIFVSEDQADDQHRQRFDTSFLGLLALQRELRSKIAFDISPEAEVARVSGKHKLYSGAVNEGDRGGGTADSVANACVEVQYRIIQRSPMRCASLNDVKFAYMKYVHQKSETVIAPYFRLIYSILDRVRRDEILSPEEKVRYGNLVRAQLSSSDVILLGINSLSPISADMKDIVTEFRLLKYLPSSSMKRLLQRLHDPKAFTGRDDLKHQEVKHNHFRNDDRYRSTIAAFHAERLMQRIDKVDLANKLGRPAGFVSDYENGWYKLSLVESVDVSRALKKHIAIFLRY